MEEDIKILEEFILNGSLNICCFMPNGIKPSDRIKQSLENLIKGYRELKEINESFIWQSNFDMKFYEENYIPKSKIKEKMEEQLKEANDVLENGNYLDNFNGDKNEQDYYYNGYKDATLFIQELMEGK